jgi:Ca-activated chloride channel family protein
LAILAGLFLGPPSGTELPAKPGAIQGTVKDQDGGPLAGAAVVVEGTALRTTTDRRGGYLISNIPPGRVTVVAQLVGYGQARQVVTVPDGRVVTVDFSLVAARLRLEEMAAPVSADRASIGGVAAMRKSTIGYAQPSPYPSAREFNTEEYRYFKDNAWASPLRQPLSTFAIDVDAGSYSNVRRFLKEGRLPPKDAVRVEEMINYFRYDYPDARGEHPFSVTTELASAPWRPGHKLALIGLQSRRLSLRDLPPNNLVFLIDVSGSMNGPDRLPLVKSAFRLLVNELRDEDRVAIVVYAGAAGLVLPPTRGNDKDRILDAIERLEAGGSTAGGAGIQLAYQVARDNFLREGNNRVILATDGDFNVGTSSEGDLVRMIEERRRDGVFLTVLGFGRGNLKDAKMEQLANKGNGHYGYVDDLLEAKKVFVQELGATLYTIAKDVKIQVEFNPARVKSYRLVGYENRLLADRDFNDDTKDAGEMGAGHAVTALYEIVPVGVDGDDDRSVDPLKYQVRAERDRRPDSSEDWFTVKLRYKQPEGSTSRLLERVVRTESANPSADFRFASAVAGFGMLLRDSEYKGRASYGDVIALARGARGVDEEGYRSEFIRLVETAATLAGRGREITADER